MRFSGTSPQADLCTGECRPVLYTGLLREGYPGSIGERLLSIEQRLVHLPESPLAVGALRCNRSRYHLLMLSQRELVENRSYQEAIPVK